MAENGKEPRTQLPSGHLGAEENLIPGITCRSVAASIFSMLVMGMYIQFAEVILSDGSALAEKALPIPAIAVFLGLVLVCGGLYALGKWTLLSRQELLCVLFTMLLSAPMMTQGMWHRFVGLIAAPSHNSRFAYIDAYSDKLWPHGKNLVKDGLRKKVEKSKDEKVDKQDSLTLVAQGNPPSWEEIEYEKGLIAKLPVLSNEKPEDISSLTLKIPLKRDGKSWLEAGQPYLVSFLVKPEKLAPESFYFARIYQDDESKYNEIINGKELAKKTFLHREGFIRIGSYNTIFSAQTKEYARVEIGLKGIGRMAVYDPKVFNVAALEGVYQGRLIVRESTYKDLAAEERGNLIVKPDNMWSWSGLKFLISGYIPVGDWLQTAVTWTIPIALLLLGTLAVNVIMRKQWAENERYPFPLFQIPNALLGAPEEGTQPAFARVFRNRYLWAGFALALFVALMRGWNLYNPKVPNLNLTVNCSDAFVSPVWRSVFSARFTISIILVSLAMFFELNVLFSLVVGFFLYRALFGIGEAFELKIYKDYPFRYQQAIGGFIGYALVVLFFTRKYLWNIVKAVAKNDRDAWKGEAFSYRTALILLVVVFTGLALWAAWLGVSVLGILIFFSFLLLIGFVSTKFRAECGIPSAYFSPYNAMLFILLLGGMHVFGAKGTLVCLVASGFLTVSCFFFIPGAQMELLEYGRRHRVIPRHLIYTVILGIAGGLFIGGWVFLANSYAIGGQNIKYQWAYEQDWFFGSYRTELATATTEMLKSEKDEPKDEPSPDAAAGSSKEGETVSGWRPEPSTWAYLYAGGVTIILTVLRQLFAGFWFHPIGFILGSSHMAENVWGSVLIALLIRFIVLKLGGAATVKNKLMPFCIGMFVGGMCGMMLFTGYAIYLRQLGVEKIHGLMP